MKVAITGASGFLGKEIIRLLLSKENNTIIAFTSQKVVLKDFFRNKNLIIYDRHNFRNGQLNNVDVLLNCAFPRNNDGTQMALGLAYIKEVLQTSVEAGVKKVINISSQSVYSQKKDTPASENSNLSLDSLYAVGKYASELLTNTICSHIIHTNIRLASLIGPHFDQRVVNKMVDSALKYRKITILDGVQKFGFMDIVDAAKAIVHVMESDSNELDEVYNLGISSGYSLEDIANCIKSNFALKGIYINIDKSSNNVYVNSEVDNKKYCNKFGELITAPIEKTIDKIIRQKLKSESINNK